MLVLGDPDNPTCALVVEVQSEVDQVPVITDPAEALRSPELALLLKLLRLRGFVVPDALQTRIVESRDIERLDEWAARLLSASSLADVFGDEAP